MLNGVSWKSLRIYWPPHQQNNLQLFDYEYRNDAVPREFIGLIWSHLLMTWKPFPWLFVMSNLSTNESLLQDMAIDYPKPNRNRSKLSNVRNYWDIWRASHKIVVSAQWDFLYFSYTFSAECMYWTRVIQLQTHVWQDHKNIERHTAHTIVSLPGLKQW